MWSNQLIDPRPVPTPFVRILRRELIANSIRTRYVDTFSGNANREI